MPTKRMQLTTTTLSTHTTGATQSEQLPLANCTEGAGAPLVMPRLLGSARAAGRRPGKSRGGFAYTRPQAKSRAFHFQFASCLVLPINMTYRTKQSMKMC